MEGMVALKASWTGLKEKDERIVPKAYDRRGESSTIRYNHLLILISWDSVHARYMP